MAASVTLDVQLNADSVRVLMQIPRDMLEGRTPVPPAAINRGAALEQAAHTANVLKTVFLGLKSPNSSAEFDKLRNEVADFGIWVNEQIEALKAKDAK